jgi:pimeloyl-ACP methyl ester carboxylesterase
VASFRKSDRSEIPVLLIHGDLDLATPIENAEELLESHPNGHLIRIHGGTHAAAHHAAGVLPEFPQWLHPLLHFPSSSCAKNSTAFGGDPVPSR